MPHYNPTTNLLEEEYYHYELQDVDEPQLYRDVFPYHDVPRIVFNHRQVPMNPPEQIYISDTTFRDGQQSRPPFTPQQIATIYDMLHRLSGPKGIVRACEFFVYTERDREALRLCQERGYEFPEVTSWIRASRKDFQLVRELGIKETGMLTSCSDYHIFHKLNMKRSEAMDNYLAVVKMALEEGIVPRCHLEDITRADFYGFVIPFVRELMKLSEEAKMPIKVRACDTLGFGVTYPGVALPRSVRGIIYGLRFLGGVPADWLEWHGHNDFYNGLVNATTAWLYGCGVANGTCLGIGERTGNTPVEALAIEYCALRGTNDGMDLSVITEIADYFARETGMCIPDNQPFVGANFNVTKAGIHADGLYKDEEIYNIFDTGKILNRPPGVAVTDKSGLAGIAQWINVWYRLEGDARVSKDHPGVLQIKELIDEQYASGRVTQVSDQEMVQLAAQFVGIGADQ
ncbi:MAG: 2-isopropylmalate synthase [Armatimonadetes bacterium]|jgi:isopropylmalate/homocitrate/citramalate synthase|nr:2-isopropylmalate synthase [Armatimonadota bacterium]